MMAGPDSVFHVEHFLFGKGVPMSKIVKSKPRLGRGLSSLISVSELPVEAEVPGAEDSPIPVERPLVQVDPVALRNAPITPPAAKDIPVVPPTNGQPTEIPLDRIRVNPHQPRKTMDDARLAELAASLRSTGLIQPIVVKAIGDTYELIAGERRWRASKLAGLTVIPAYIRDVDGFTQAQMALVENIQREDLNPIDRAQAYRMLIDQLGLTQSELSNRLGEDRSSIANFLRLLELTGPVKDLVRTGQLSLGHAKLLAGVSEIVEQQRLADLVVAQELSVRNLERLLQQGTTPAETSTRSAPSAHLQDLERSLTRQLGMKVQVKSTSKKGKGRMVIHYSSLDEFDDLIAKLGLKSDE